MEKLKEKELKVWGILSIIVLLAWAMTVGVFYNNYKVKEVLFLDRELERFEGEVQSTLITYEEFSNYIFDEINQDEEILSIMYQANFASNEEKEILRERLHNKVSKKYPIMQKYKFRQFHFHLPTTESFLRVHIPEKYGDLLIDSRESVRLVNETKTEISGFEEGKIFNGFRNVYPMQYNKQHVGSVEISMSSVSIIEILSQLHEARDFYFIIDKLIVQEKLFADQLENYRESNVIENYYVDIGVDEVTSMNNTIAKDSEELFFNSFDKKYLKKIEEKESFSLVHKLEETSYVVNFLAIKNFKEKPSAYLISISQCIGGYNKFIQDMYGEITLVTFLAFFIIAFGLSVALYQIKLKDSAELDYLTNIYNRNKFYDITEREIKIAKRYNQDLSILFMDIDHFKEINDANGHAWGDQVLQGIANTILKNIRAVDVLARWGGEEFVLLLPNTGKEGALIAAEKIRKLIDNSKCKELKDVTLSIGVSVVNPEDYNVNEAIGQADAAMYEAKRKGRNQVYFK